VRVQEVMLNDYKMRYMLLDKEGFPVVPVMKYLKYLDNTGKSRNTLKTYCYALKQYFTFLVGEQKEYIVAIIRKMPLSSIRVRMNACIG
jgi:integrase/recombinase XerD